MFSVREAIAIARAHGHPIGYVREDNPRYGIAPCPVCGDERRHTRTKADKRGAVLETSNGMGWLCLRDHCGASGSGYGLLIALGIDAKSELRWRGHIPLPPLPAQLSQLPHADYPPNAERYYQACAKLSDPHAKALYAELFCHDRKIDFARLSSADVCRVTAPSGPQWATFAGKPWSELGYCITVPLYDHLGALRSVQARHHSGASPKSANPKGYRIGGLVMRNSASLSSRSDHTLIVEGIPDYLNACSISYSHHIAVVGVTSGGWVQGHADSIPDGNAVTIATHDDIAGKKYANHIIETLERSKRTFDVTVSLVNQRKPLGER